LNRAKLKALEMPDYTHGEEIFNMVTHIVGAAFGLFALILCVSFSVIYNDPWAVAGSIVYGVSLVLLYTVSSVYHGLSLNLGKKVMRIIDHCTIYLLIAGTYTPIVLCAVRRESPFWGWTVFAIVWGLAAMATTLTAIDMKKYSKLSMACYIGMGWSILICVKTALKALTLSGFIWILSGGIAYTIGAVIYGIGKKHRYVHSVFHIFVVIGSVLQFICVFFYVI